MSEQKTKQIGISLKLERLKIGSSQDEIAKKADLTQTTVSHIERGDINYSIETLERYIDALGLKLNLISKDSELFHYTARVQSVYDGDTCRVDIDLGLGIWIRNEKLRLVRINAPEMMGDDRVIGYWLNTSSGIRRNSNCRCYENTKRGRPCHPRSRSIAPGGKYSR